jgi:hypothetical protein
MISCTEHQDYLGGFEEENIENYTLETSLFAGVPKGIVSTYQINEQSRNLSYFYWNWKHFNSMLFWRVVNII